MPRRVAALVFSSSWRFFSGVRVGIRRRGPCNFHRQVLAAHGGDGRRWVWAARLRVAGLNRPRRHLRHARRPLPARSGWRAAGVLDALLPGLADAVFDLLPQRLRDPRHDHISRLGGPASHGCVRLHPGEAATLFMLVHRFGMANTSIMITGAIPSRQAARQMGNGAVENTLRYAQWRRAAGSACAAD